MSDPKSTTVGTCAVCSREIAVRFRANADSDADAHLVHHGFQRPGDGMIHGDCFAVDYPPHEVSPKAAEAWMKICAGWKRDAESYLARLQTGVVSVLHRPLAVPVPTTLPRPPSHYWDQGKPGKDPGWIEWREPFTYDETDPKRQQIFRELVAAAIRQAEQRIRWTGEEIDRMVNLTEAWAEQPLRDRPKVEPAATGRRRRRGIWRTGPT